MCSAKDRYTLIEQSSNYKIICMQHSQKNFMRIIGNDQKNNGQNFWEILERIIGKILSIIGAGLEQRDKEAKQQEKQKESRRKCDNSASSRPKRRKAADNVDNKIDNNRCCTCFGVYSDDEGTAREWVV